MVFRKIVAESRFGNGPIHRLLKLNECFLSELHVKTIGCFVGWEYILTAKYDLAGVTSIQYITIPLLSIYF